MSCLPRLDSCILRHPERWAALEDEIRRIDLVLSTAPEEVKDKCKTLCESVVKSMLISAESKSEEECENSDLNALKAWLSEIMDFNDTDSKVIKAEITYLYEARNRSGTSGHGRSLQRQREIRDAVDARDNERHLSLTDSLISDLIYRFEKQFPLNNDVEHRDEHFDVWLDSEYGNIKIIEAEYLASEVLFSLDPTAYKEGQKQFNESGESDD